MLDLAMKRPCTECPFVCGTATNLTLAPGRLDEIKEKIKNDSSFTCHKTLESREQQHCAGAMIYLERIQRPNQLMRIGERLNIYSPGQLDMTVDIDMDDAD